MGEGENQSSPWDAEIDAAFSETVDRAKASGTSKPKTHQSGQTLTPEQVAILQGASEQIARLYEPEYWRGLVRSPADYMLMSTGHEWWDIPDKKVDAAAVPLSLFAKMTLTVDPKWLCLLLACMNLGYAYAPAIAKEIAQSKADNAKLGKPELVK